jgi:hypothetical protein
MTESDVGMILSSIVEETRVFHNPFDLNMCSLDRDAHANYLNINAKHGLVMKPLSSCNSYGDYFFYNLDYFFTKSFNYTTINNLECNKHFE